MVEQLLLNLIIVFVGIAVIPLIARKIGIPVMVAEIAFGILIGKSLLHVLPENNVIEFLAEFGLVYLIFLAGLEIDFKTIMEKLGDTTTIALFSLVGAFASGAFIAPMFGIHPLLLGSVLGTTGLGLVMPLTKEIKSKTKALTVVLGSVVLVDIISIFALAISLAYIGGEIGASFLYSFLIILVLFILPWLINRFKIGNKIEIWLRDKAHFDMEVRLAFALIISLGALSGELGFHAIMGAFVAGLIISEITPQASELEHKLNSFGYGFFIPLFFIFTGAEVNLRAVFLNMDNFGLLLLLIATGMLSKLISVYLASRIRRYSNLQSLSFAFLHTSRLSLIIAAANVGLNAGLMDQKVFSMLVLFALSMALTGPMIGKKLYLMWQAKNASAVEQEETDNTHKSPAHTAP